MRILSTLLLVLASCGDDAPPPSDAGADGGISEDASTDAEPRVGPAAEARAPTLTPCPPGWREVAPASEGDVASCSPWPDGGPEDCPVGEAHFPGTKGCELVSVPCPSDGFPADLPTTTPVLYVRAGATTTDGTRDAPFGTIGEAVAVAPPGATIAIATGTYEESVTVITPMTLRGACAETVLRGGLLAGTIHVIDAADVHVADLRISGSADGIWSDAADVTIERVIVDGDPFLCLRNARGGTMRGSRLSLRDCATGVATQGSTTELRMLEVRRPRMEGLRTFGGSLVVEDVAIEEAAGDLAPLLVNGGSLSVTRGSFSPGVGDTAFEVYVFRGSTLSLTDTVFSGPPLDVVSEPVTILAIDPDAHLDFTRVSFERLRGLGVALTEAGSTLAMRDVRIVDVVPATIRGGHAIEIGVGAALDAERLLVLRATGYGVLLDGAGTSGSLRDLVVRDTREEMGGTAGRALQVQTGAVATVERALVRDNREVAVVAASPSTMLTLFDLVVERTAARACAPAACPEAGIGVGSYLGASLRVERFRISDNHLIGLQVAQDGEMDLANGLVSGHPVGVNVQVEGYDVMRLSNGVVFRDNETNLDARSLPVPDPMASITM